MLNTQANTNGTLIHHYLTSTALPYISNASVIETRPHFVAGSNVVTSLRGFCQKRNGFPVYTTDVFTSPIQRIFGWRLWAGAFFVMANEVGGGTSKVYKLKVGTDVTFVLIFTSSTASPFDFTTSNNVVYFGNGTDMKKYDGTTVSNWGIAKPAAAPTATASAGGSINGAAGGYSWKYAFGNASTHIGSISNPSAYTGNFTGRNYTITGSTTSDTQVTLVHIYRTADGGSTWYELPNSPIAYSIGWSIVDSAIDTALNTSAQASLPGMNDPPLPSRGCTFFAGRQWSYVGDKLLYSNFEEEINGINGESFYNINVYHMGSEVTGLAVCQRALMVFTSSTIQRIIGDSLATFTRQSFVNRMGVHEMANIAPGGGRVVAWLDNSGTAFITDGISVQEVGLPIRTDLDGIDAAKSAMSFHGDGIRQWMMISDAGQNKSWVYDNDNGQWMVPWSIGGYAIHSAETSVGVYTLLTTTSNGLKILKLDTTSYADAGVTYTESLTTGLMDLGPGKGPGEVGNIEYIALERGSAPLADVLTLTDDDPATVAFTSIFANQQDPPDRTQGTNLQEKWYWQRTGTARRGAVKMTWTAGDAWQLYSMDLVSAHVEDIDAG